MNFKLDENQNRGCFWELGVEWLGSSRAFRGKDDVILRWGAGLTGVCICHSSGNLGFVHFTICKSYPLKKAKLINDIDVEVFRSMYYYLQLLFEMYPKMGWIVMININVNCRSCRVK